MFRNIREYINETELKITLLKNRVNVLNYDRIRDITDKEIILTKGNDKIKIIGNNLKLNKLLDQEVLIIGNILRVELDD
ncbi:MAG: hypothetical protein KHW57_00870 [Clostridium sp.]|jgi:hypothetical protein|nr:hypothetical protein [Clostridium sp.]MEE0092264.1 YabP/YqfC family sporulation protein [Bacilli bacterium]